MANNIRWSEDQLAAYKSRKGRAQANAEAREKKDVRPKYRNKKTQVDGRTFDSKLEASHYVELRRAEEAGIIEGLKCQVPFVLEINAQLVCKYIADFTFIEAGRLVVADSKGVRTREYQIKKKLMKAIHGIEIRELARKPKRP